MARKFLWLVAIFTGLVIAGAIVWRIFAEDLIRIAFVPTQGYSETGAPQAPNYAVKESWIAHPELPNNPALWAPQGFSVAPRPAAALFYIAPTSWISRRNWNAPLDDPETNDRLDRFVRMQASAFNGVAEIWAPRYRQATFGGFLSPSPDMRQALALAYGDVERAFDKFLAAQPPGRPIILAGHSQGGLHLLHLLKLRRAALTDRMVAAYVVGWPVALPDDPKVLDIPACTAVGQSGCIVSWQTFAADSDLKKAVASFAPVPDVSGRPLGDRRMLCINPLTGDRSAAEADRNAGALVDDRLVPHKVGARCEANGLLLIAPPSDDIGPFVLPNGNFHVYDFSLFWANVRADVEARLSTFGASEAIAADGVVG